MLHELQEKYYHFSLGALIALGEVFDSCHQGNNDGFLFALPKNFLLYKESFIVRLNLRRVILLQDILLKYIISK